MIRTLVVGRLPAYIGSLSRKARTGLGAAITLAAAGESVVFAASGEVAFPLLLATLCGAGVTFTLIVANGSSRGAGRLAAGRFSHLRTRLRMSLKTRSIDQLLALAGVALFVPLAGVWVGGLALAAEGVPFAALAPLVAILALLWSALLMRPRLRYPRHSLRSVR